MKTRNIGAVVAVVALVLAASGTAEAKSKFHFLKSKKFWGCALAAAVPSATAGALASQRNGNNAPFPSPTAATPRKPH